MKKIYALLLLCLSMNFAKAQDDWKLPMVKDKIVFEFTSPIMTGKMDLCEIYTSLDYMTAISTKCTDVWINKSLSKIPGVFSKHNTTQLYPKLYGVGQGVEGFSTPKCIKGKPDTLVGSLNMVLETSKFFSGYKGGQITCVYRIILYNDKINVKFKGFELKASKVRNGSSSGSLGPAKSLETETRPLEEEYKNLQTKKVDQEYWSDFKAIIGLYYKLLETELAQKRGALNFED
jgi:hypothetical protein